MCPKTLCQRRSAASCAAIGRKAAELAVATLPVVVGCSCGRFLEGDGDGNGGRGFWLGVLVLECRGQRKMLALLCCVEKEKGRSGRPGG